MKNRELNVNLVSLDSLCWVLYKGLHIYRYLLLHCQLTYNKPRFTTYWNYPQVPALSIANQLCRSIEHTKPLHKKWYLSGPFQFLLQEEFSKSQFFGILYDWAFALPFACQGNESKTSHLCYSNGQRPTLDPAITYASHVSPCLASYEGQTEENPVVSHQRISLARLQMRARPMMSLARAAWGSLIVPIIPVPLAHSLWR
jgi:hypothetical protein